MSERKPIVQKIWGVLLFMVGLAMFVTIPERVREIQEAGRYISGLKFGFYFISVFLMAGGAKKIYENYLKKNDSSDNSR